MTLTVLPLGNRVVVKAKARDEISKGGIYLADTANTPPTEGTVVATGPDVGTVNPGDNVIFMRYAGTPFEYDGNEVLLFNVNDILARVLEG